MVTRLLLSLVLVLLSAILLHAQGVLLTADDFYLRGVEKLSKKDYFGAVAELTEAYELDDSDAKISRTLAYALLMTGDLEKSAEYYERTLSLEPGDAESAMQLTLINLDDQVQDYDKAIQYAELATQLDPSNDRALYVLAKAYERAGRLVEAESYYRRFMETFLESDYRENVGTALKKLNKDTFVLTYRVNITNNESYPITSVKSLVMLGRDFGRYQKTVLLSATPEFTEVMSDSQGNRFVEYKFDKIRPGETIELRFNYLIEIRPTIWEISGPTTANVTQDLASYLWPEKLIESNSQPVALVANALTSGITDANEKARKIYDYVTTNLVYNVQPQSLGAEHAITNPDEADCTEFAALFVALCRAAGIPARVIFGFVREPGETYIGTSHAWGEFYLDDFGWIPADPTFGSRYATEYFARVDADHIALWSSSPLFLGKWSVIVFHGSRNPDAELYSIESAEIGQVGAAEPSLEIAKLMDFPRVVAQLPPLEGSGGAQILLLWSGVFFFLIIVSLILTRRLAR
jgi:transglutaminase-like putative cysteine protease/Flp pilus assembly protein TadD